jgi:hypothetical protein
MPLTKVTKSGISNNAIDADKIEDGTIVAADITPGTITADKLNSTLDLSSKTVTLANSTVTNAQLAGSIANAKLANSSVTINGTSVSLGSSISAGSLQWQSVQTSGFTAVAGRGYFCNTSSAAFTVTLPASATIGDTIALIDYAGTFATYKLTIDRNGHNIQGVANNSQIGTNRASVTLVYVDNTKGWVYQDESNVADLQTATFISATGGTITTSGNFKIHTFTGDGSFVVSQVGNPAGGPSNVDYLVVAGGGSGQSYGGGGGAGGYRTSFPSPGCNAGSFPISVTTYPITVGAGGTAPGSFSANSGSPSIFSTITSSGGGRGSGGCGPGLPADPFSSGGSGGGGGAGGWAQAAGAGNTPPVSPPQGNPGGTGTTAGGGSSGGGGGASTSGTAASGGNAGPGGSGSTNSISGSPVTYAGGGGGAPQAPGTPGTGGPGGGGTGGPPGGNAGTAGSSNTGGGGGASSFGASYPAGGAGGKGIVIIRYKYQ